jgi:hypothetical protein
MQKPMKHDVVRLFGDLTDQFITEVLETGATLEDLEEAAAYLFGETDGVADARIPLGGTAATVHDIVIKEQRFAPRDR